MMKFIRISIGCMLLISMVTSCGWFETKQEKPAPELATDGMDAYRDGKYDKAIASFETLKDWYPFSKYAILAELKIADSYYQLKQYEDAVFTYEEFARLHPRNEATPYVIYQIGRCYFDQLDTVDRDQTSTQKALEAFDKLVSQYPQNSYAVTAEEHMRECLKLLAGHEFYVGLFYFKSKRYKAALHRFKAVLNHYPDTGVHYQALQYIARCEASIAKRQKNN